MKKLEIIVPDQHLKTVADIIERHGGSGYSYYAVQGKGTVPEIHLRFKIEVITKDERVGEIIKEVSESVGGYIRTGGVIFVSDVSDAVNLMSGKKGEAAI